MATDQEEALLRVVGILDALGIRYLLTGSLAASIYVEPRMTRDVDILIDPQSADQSRLLQALAPDFVVFEEAVDEAFERRSMFNAIDQRNLAKVDIIVRDNQRDPETLFERATIARVGASEIRTIAAEDLIASKLRWASASKSAVQFRDVRKLMSLPHIDREYLSQRIADMGLDDTLKEALDERYDA